MDRQCCNAIVVRRSERAQYQFAIDAHKAHTGVGAKNSSYRLVTLLESGQQFCGISAARPSAIGEPTHGGALIASVQCDVEPELDLIPGKIFDHVRVTNKFDWTDRRGVVERIIANKATAIVLWDGRKSTEVVPIRSVELEPAELGTGGLL